MKVTWLTDPIIEDRGRRRSHLCNLCGVGVLVGPHQKTHEEWHRQVGELVNAVAEAVDEAATVLEQLTRSQNKRPAVVDDPVRNPGEVVRQPSVDVGEGRSDRVGAGQHVDVLEDKGSFGKGSLDGDPQAGVSDDHG